MRSSIHYLVSLCHRKIFLTKLGKNSRQRKYPFSFDLKTCHKISKTLFNRINKIPISLLEQDFHNWHFRLHFPRPSSISFERRATPSRGSPNSLWIATSSCAHTQFSRERERGWLFNPRVELSFAFPRRPRAWPRVNGTHNFTNRAYNRRYKTRLRFDRLRGFISISFSKWRGKRGTWPATSRKEGSREVSARSFLPLVWIVPNPIASKFRALLA